MALDKGKFIEGHELPSKWQVAKAMIGRRLSQEEAKRWSTCYVGSIGLRLGL